MLNVKRYLKIKSPKIRVYIFKSVVKNLVCQLKLHTYVGCFVGINFNCNYKYIISLNKEVYAINNTLNSLDIYQLLFSLF